jgi:hypothetical protein
MMVLGALNWAAEWWNPRRGSLDTVVRTAQSIVRHGLGTQQVAADAETTGRKPKVTRKARAAVP